MAWEVIERGHRPTGEPWVIERQVVYLPGPGTANRLPIRLRSFRWQVRQPGGRWTVEATARSRSEIEVAAHDAEGVQRHAP
jgi:hypothetical protein